MVFAKRPQMLYGIPRSRAGMQSLHAAAIGYRGSVDMFWPRWYAFVIISSAKAALAAICYKPQRIKIQQQLAGHISI